ncbi:hypothetical protein [Aeromicrobium sp. 9AM]|uniref:hypothetical protein n=1 Tax=Aeromicrobium sp. 9AM TaxID=2653126 RepID=UPI0012F187EF|nr:hypothetical protein [Aeromicrobium sp. 9AM]VXB88588.1 conserved hypothetical protein [Aeromicrobium sp. 9AM]
MRSWLRGNRIALLLLPIALITALLASSSRIEDYWWGKGLHQAVRADSSGVARFKDAYDDGYLTYPIAADISLTSVEPVTTIDNSVGVPQPVTVPEGAMLWRVVLGFRADPDVVLWGCHIAIVDTNGTRYDAESRQFQSFGATPIYSCVPDDTPGPKPVIGSTAKPKVADGESPRPPAYEAETYVVTPKGVKPDNVRVWWIPPKYAELPVDETSRG